MKELLREMRERAGVESKWDIKPVDEAKRKVGKPEVIQGLELLTPYSGPVKYVTDDGKYTWRLFKRTAKTATIGSDSDVDAGARFSGKRYTYKWDGTGFHRGGEYLYIKK